MTKKIVVVEPFYSGSHKLWTDALVDIFRSEGHEVIVLTLPGRHWKWRMQGAATYLAEKLTGSGICPDVLIASDMIDLSVFVGAARNNLARSKIVVYFHENQMTYPWSPEDKDVQLKRDQSYGLINLRTALVADQVYFNSYYHQSSFIGAIKGFIKQFPDAVNKKWGSEVERKSSVLYLGMHLSELTSMEELENEPVLLWNHRWEYDKSPEVFYKAIVRLKKEGVEFKLIICGEKNKNYPEVFDRIQVEFSDRIIHFGYAQTREEYYQLLKKSSVLPVTCHQDFFGGSVVEGIAAGCMPVLPNRLSYPEHLPNEFKSRYLMDSDEAWYQLLKKVVTNIAAYAQDRREVREYVGKYDWSRLKESYLEMVK